MPTRDDVPDLPWGDLPAFVVASTWGQGVPPTVDDPDTLAKVAALFGPLRG